MSAAGAAAPVTPKKSYSDDREYRIVKLKNDLVAILVSDPETDKVAGPFFACAAARVAYPIATSEFQIPFSIPIDP